MVQTLLSVSVLNVIKFAVLEIFVSVLLEPSWELFIAHIAHKDIVRGRKVRLRTFWNWRSWPCQISAGRYSRVLAITLSLLALVAAFMSEYSVEATLKRYESSEQSTIYSKDIGRRNASDDMQNLVSAVTAISSECLYKRDTKFFVNSTFVEPVAFSNERCVSNSASETFEVSDVCVLTNTEAEASVCLFDRQTGDFIVSELLSNQSLQNDESASFLTEAYNVDVADILVHSCNFNGNCTVTNSSDNMSVRLFCKDDEEDLRTCLYTSSRWLAITQFTMPTLRPGRGEIPLLLYRTLEGQEALSASDISAVDLKVMQFFEDSFSQGLTYSTFQISRKREGIILMLLMEGFGRSIDRKLIRDYRGDRVEAFADLNLYYLIPLFVLMIISLSLFLFSKVTYGGRHKVLEVPVTTDQLMRCARAREVHPSESAFGHPEKGLLLGLVEENGIQRFSVSAEAETFPYNSTKFEIGMEGPFQLEGGTK